MSDKIEQGELRISAALAFCKQHGLSISESGLRAAGFRDGFAHKIENAVGVVHCIFRQDDLGLFIRRALDKPPNGYFTVQHAAELLGITRQGVYWKAKAGRLETMIIGPGHGVLYVRVRADERKGQ